MHGLPGCGKTLLARAVAHESSAAVYLCQRSGDHPEVLRRERSQAPQNFRRCAKGARPASSFSTRSTALAPKRERVEGEVEKRVVAQLLALMDGLKSRGEVIVMAATNRPNSIDPALRRPGRFDREIAIGIPNNHARREILEIYARGMPLAEDVDVSRLWRVRRMDSPAPI